MAAGDLIILKNTSDTSSVPNAGGTLNAQFSAVDQQFGSFARSGANVTLPSGIYLICYSEKFETSDTTNNERIEINGEIHVSGTGAVGGYGSDYIRKSSGHQSCVVSGYTILELASQSDIFIQFSRGDNSNDTGVNRVIGTGGLMILELDDTHSYGLYSTSSSASITATESVLPLDTNDRQDPGISRIGSVVSTTDAGRYLVTYSLDISQTATGREDVVARLTNFGTTVPGSHGYCYVRGADGNQDGALTWIGVVDLPALAQLDVRCSVPQSATFTVAAGAKLQIWQLPIGNETAIKEATTGDYNANAVFDWDTTPHIDTAGFTDTNANTVTLDNEGMYMAFATFKQFAPDTPQRASPEVRMRLDGVNSDRAAGNVYHRNSGGSGLTSVTVADMFFASGGSNTLQVQTAPAAVSGPLINDDGQFSVLSLNAIFGTYIPPPIITDVDGDDQVLDTQTSAILSGDRFGAVQGTGRLEMWDDISGTTKVTQTINSWNDTEINFDVVSGSITDDATRYFVVVEDGGLESPPFPFYLGVLPLDDYFTIIANQSPDHWWRFDNDAYADQTGARPFTAVVFGDGGAFEADPICEENTHSWRLNDRANGGRRECANSTFINDGARQTRALGGWIKVAQIDSALSCIYEEGGGVNNVCFLLGMGNILIASYADTGDDNAQAFSDFPLDPDREYHILWRFDHTESTSEFRLYIDGVKQQVTTGNPLVSGDLDSHTGDITMGGQGSSLEVGGTDVTFQAQLDTNYANWCSWSTRRSDSEILELFQRGARPKNTIASDTPSNMQVAVDALSDTALDNHALSIRVFEPNTGVADNLSLDFDNITFNARTSMQLEWRGAGTLTVTNLNGSNLDQTKCVSTRGGNVVVVNPAILTLTGLENPTEVRVYEAGTDTEVAGQEDVTSGTFSASVQVNAVDIVIHSLGEQNQRILNVDTSAGDVTLPIQQRTDRQYLNP